jgi:hypothetical protein
MWNKIYLTVLAAAILAMGVLLYLPFSWLQSIGAPATVRDNYLITRISVGYFCSLLRLILLIAGNVVLWKTRRSWAMWTTLLYFAVFMVAQTFWLENSFFRFKQENNFA